MPSKRSRAWCKLRDEALLLLDGKGALLDTAREISAALKRSGLAGAVIGGIAVVLHGYPRTTTDIDIFIEESLAPVAVELASLGFAFDPIRREFKRDGIPVHLVTIEQIGSSPNQVVEIAGITTVSLADLIAMKLRSGSKNLLRSIDLADVVELTRRNGLSGRFVSKLGKDVRPAFREILRAIRSDSHDHPRFGPGHGKGEGR